MFELHYLLCKQILRDFPVKWNSYWALARKNTHKTASLKALFFSDELHFCKCYIELYHSQTLASKSAVIDRNQPANSGRTLVVGIALN